IRTTFLRFCPALMDSILSPVWTGRLLREIMAGKWNCLDFRHSVVHVSRNKPTPIRGDHIAGNTDAAGHPGPALASRLRYCPPTRRSRHRHRPRLSQGRSSVTVLHGPGPGCGRGVAETHWEAHPPPWNRSAVPFKYHAEHRHHIPKPRYRVTNWAEYDAALKRRGSLTVWFTDEAIQAWRAEPRTTPGGQPNYSALAITTALTMGMVWRCGRPRG